MTNVELFHQKYELTDKQKEQYQQYYQLIREYNKVMNLTGIDDEETVYLKHFLDSLLIVDEISAKGIKIADIGSGAGFPGIVLAIYFPENDFDLIEPLTKRCTFLDIVVDRLKLKNVKVINSRAEEIKNQNYDIITTRAVARLNILIELIIPLLKTKGIFIALKGKNYQQEILESANALNELKAEVLRINEEILPIENSMRGNIIIQKNNKTSVKYPRNFGQIKKNPL